MITSTNNPKIKNIIKLRKDRERKKQELIIIEGRKEIEIAIESGIEISELFFCSDFFRDADKLKLDNISSEELSREVFEKISYRNTPDGYLALARPVYLDLEDVKTSKQPLVVILEAVEKPGNLGAILRTADATKVDAIIINNPQTDIYNPNVVRASRGTVFSKQVVVSTIQETKKWLEKNNIKALAAGLQAKKSYTELSYKDGIAIVAGTEDKGLSQEWLEGADKLIKIPMQGKIDSLNVSVSVAVILFEAVRQREF